MDRDRSGLAKTAQAAKHHRRRTAEAWLPRDKAGCGQYDAAASWAEKALQQNSNYLPGIRMLAASHALAGRLAQAQNALARMREIDPESRISNLAEIVPFRAAQDFTRYIEGLRKAGLPE
jgi:lipopolysaccharide biosynthesis regulator YciM